MSINMIHMLKYIKSYLMNQADHIIVLIFMIYI